MRPTELVTFLRAAIKSHLPVLITGAPGVGKSNIVEQVAEDLDRDLILSHPAVADPTDAKGLPWAVTDKHGTHATFLPFGELERAIDATKETIWFLDDLGQASPAVQASYMQLLLARRVNGHVLPDCVTFIAATNRRTDRAGVSGILEPVKSRFGSIVELDPHLDDWCNWAIDAELNPMVVAFLRFKSDLLCAFQATNDLTNSPVPRTWANAARILDLDLPASVLPHAIAGAIGQGASAELLAFVRLYQELPDIDGILIDPMKTKMPTQPAVLYALSTALAHRVTKDNFSQIAKFVTRMYDDGHGEFSVLCVKDCKRRDETIVKTQAFVKLACGEIGSMISGK